MNSESLDKDQKKKDRGTVIIAVHQDDLIGPDLRWPLRIAKLGHQDITLLVGAPENVDMGGKDTALSVAGEKTPYERRIVEKMRHALDEHLGEGQWTDERSDAEDVRTLVTLCLLEKSQMVEHARQVSEERDVSQVLFVGSADAEKEQEWLAILELLLKTLDCPMAAVVPGKRKDGGKLLIAADRGLQGRAAIDLAGALAAETKHALTAVYVERDIGPDSKSVGRKILDGLLRGRDIPPHTERLVVIGDEPAKGVNQACADESFECVVLGASRTSALGEDITGDVSGKVLKSRPDLTLISVRRSLSLGTRLQRVVEFLIKRRVPQLLRADRIDLVERIQSSSQWNFDFMLLMTLATIIASLGLLDNSAAVIIGAMLLAPLMTPLLGLGLALTQGNSSLVKMTLKALAMGFLTAFGVAFIVGFMPGDFYELTDEMLARDWPRMLDLIVAFVSGIAAAYAMGRSRLLAALPGVAIAAALVPPVATAGLALSSGHYIVALGALLLFIVNIVVIVIAAALCFWAVGIRKFAKHTLSMGLLRTGAFAIMVAIVLMLVLSPSLNAPPPDMVDEVKHALSDDYRLRDITLRRKAGSLDVDVQVDVGGIELPSPALRAKLQKIAQEHIEEHTDLRLTFRYESLLK